jgi:O-antigen ligase
MAAVVISLAALLYSDESDEFLKYFQYVIALFLILSLLSIFVTPAAYDHGGREWKGLAKGKNFLGQYSLLGIILWSVAYKLSASTWKKIFSALLILLALVLLIGSKSGTSMISFGIILIVAGLYQIDKIFHPIGFKKSFSTVAIVTFLLLVCVSLIFNPDIFNVLPGLIGKNVTFTGRTFLWEEIFEEAKKHIFLGAGFQGYWVITNENLLRLYEQFVWLPNQAHNGYLDILNEVGLIGLTLFVLLLINYIINLPRLEKPNYWSWFIIVTLIINLQETTLIRPQHPTGVIFMFSYLVLFVNLMKQDENELSNENSLRMPEH